MAILPKERSPKRDKSYELWIESGKTLKLCEIAKKLDVPEATVRAWKTKDNWDGAKKNERSAPNKKRNVPISKGNAPSRAAAKKAVDKALAIAVEKNEDLSPRQKEFCLHYVRTCNATQSYVRAYGCSYSSAMPASSLLLRSVKIQNEIKELRIIKNAAIGAISGDDVVEMHMRIAFADLTDFVEFGSELAPVAYMGLPVTVENGETGERDPVMKIVNEVTLRDSTTVDGQMLSEVSQGREGTKVKLVDRQKSLAFLERYFGLNSKDKQEQASGDIVGDWIAALMDGATNG